MRDHVQLIPIDGSGLGPMGWLVRATGWLVVALVLLLGMSTCVGLYENPHNHNSPLLGWGIFAATAGAIAFIALGGAVQWAGAWRFLFSATFRRYTLDRWSHTSHSVVLRQVAFAVFSFLLLNLFFGFVLWWFGS